MLVLTRRANESIQLGDNIRITVVSVDGDRVRIGIDAPKDLKIYRMELLEEVTGINKEAASSYLGALSLEFEGESKKKLLENEKNG